jgi:hypothetical protein
MAGAAKDEIVELLVNVASRLVLENDSIIDVSTSAL